jgi:alkylhydroperoxidase/carboxymuconolactone decarboxylase family protein YurZ
MDEKTSVLVCLGAAVAANCVACFRHYHEEAQRIGLDESEIEAAVTLGAKVKTGANIAVMSAVARVVRSGAPPETTCQDARGTVSSSCCTGQD